AFDCRSRLLVGPRLCDVGPPLDRTRGCPDRHPAPTQNRADEYRRIRALRDASARVARDEGREGMSTVDATELKPFKPALAMPRSLPAVLTAIVLLVMWEGCIHIFSVPAYILPTPSAVAARFYQDLSSGLIIPHFWLTLLEVVLGFLIATVVGIGLGTAVGLIPAFDRTIYPILLAFQTVPKVAIAPLLIIWFGYGMHSKAIMAALIAF